MEPEIFKGAEYKVLHGVGVKAGGGNCKLSRWDGLYQLTSDSDEQVNIQRVNDVLKISNMLVSLNCSSEEQKNFFERNFDVYESVKIPCGYNGKYQYHIFLRNTIGFYNSPENMRESEFKNKLTREKLEQVLKETNFNKNYRRLSKKAIVAEILAKL